MRADAAGRSHLSVHAGSTWLAFCRATSADDHSQQAEVFSAASEQQLLFTSLVIVPIVIALMYTSFHINALIDDSLSVSLIAPLGITSCHSCLGGLTSSELEKLRWTLDTFGAVS